MERTLNAECKGKIGKEVFVKGWINQLRELGKINFLILRDRTGFMQVVVSDKEELNKIKNLQVGSVLCVRGKVVKAEQTELGVEIQSPEITVIAPVTDVPPIEYNKEEMTAEIDTILDNRVLTLRNRKSMAIFRVQSAVKEAFREFLKRNSFTEISSPKLLAEPSEGGAEFFVLPYFGKKAYLAQSPQFYKQIMVGVFERVFEVAPVFRAEKHNTSRHTNEYVSMDAEFGFIDNWEDVLVMAENLIRYIIEYVCKNCDSELKMFGAKRPKLAENAPRIKISEIHELYFKETGTDLRKEIDLSPDEEKFICKYSLEKWGSDIVFATHFLWAKRPFYTKRSKENPEETNSADMLFKGVEIMTGGQRENDYKTLIEQAKIKGVTLTNIKSYIDAFRFGMPPEGGFAFGSERITQKLLDIQNVKLATMFPRDVDRLVP